MGPLRLARCVPLLLILNGCAEFFGVPQPQVRPAAAAAVSQASEQGGRFIALVGPHVQYSEPFLGVPGTNFAVLRTWIDTKTGQRLTQLYVEDSYDGGERNYDAAREGNGAALKFVPISRNEITCSNGCSYAEEFAAELPEAWLRAHMAGATVVFSTKSGPDLAIAVPGDLIAKQVAAIDNAPAAAAAAPGK